MIYLAQRKRHYQKAATVQLHAKESILLRKIILHLIHYAMFRNYSAYCHYVYLHNLYHNHILLFYLHKHNYWAPVLITIW